MHTNSNDLSRVRERFGKDQTLNLSAELLGLIFCASFEDGINLNLFLVCERWMTVATSTPDLWLRDAAFTPSHPIPHIRPRPTNMSLRNATISAAWLGPLFSTACIFELKDLRITNVKHPEDVFNDLGAPGYCPQPSRYITVQSIQTLTLPIPCKELEWTRPLFVQHLGAMGRWIKGYELTLNRPVHPFNPEVYNLSVKFLPHPTTTLPGLAELRLTITTSTNLRSILTAISYARVGPSTVITFIADAEVLRKVYSGSVGPNLKHYLWRNHELYHLPEAWKNAEMVQRRMTEGDLGLPESPTSQTLPVATITRPEGVISDGPPPTEILDMPANVALLTASGAAASPEPPAMTSGSAASSIDNAYEAHLSSSPGPVPAMHSTRYAILVTKPSSDLPQARGKEPAASVVSGVAATRTAAGSVASSKAQSNTTTLATLMPSSTLSKPAAPKGPPAASNATSLAGPVCSNPQTAAVSIAASVHPVGRTVTATTPRKLDPAIAPAYASKSASPAAPVGVSMPNMASSLSKAKSASRVTPAPVTAPGASRGGPESTATSSRHSLSVAAMVRPPYAARSSGPTATSAGEAAGMAASLSAVGPSSASHPIQSGKRKRRWHGQQGQHA